MSVDRQTWDFEYFTIVCALLRYWTEHEINDEEKDTAQKALDGVITYSNVIRRPDDEFVRVTVTPERLSYISTVIGRYQGGWPGESALDLTVDYLSMSEQETQKWKDRMQARREANQRYLAELKEAERLAKLQKKEKVMQQDMQKIRDYMDDRKGLSIVKSRMARDLGMQYDRCLKLCKILASQTKDESAAKQEVMV